MFVNNFNYNEFSKQVLIKDAFYDIFEYVMTSYYRVELRVDFKSGYLNSIKDRVVHAIRLVNNYSKGNIVKIDTAVTILKKTDLKKIYSKMSGIPSFKMKGYVKCKTFCNKLKEYINGQIYEICYMEGYGGGNCREIDADILFSIGRKFDEC